MTEYVRSMENEKAYGISNFRGIFNALAISAVFWGVFGIGIALVIF